MWGGWLTYLCSAPVQDRNEERMARDNSGPGVHKSGFRSKLNQQINIIIISAVFSCVGVVRCEDSPRAHQMG